MTSQVVLIVDDDPWFRAIARDLLERAGYQVLEADSATEGRRMLHAQLVDLLIADILMPKIYGFSIIADARQEFPDLKILAVSGIGTDSGYLRAARLVGAHATLEKPATTELFYESVECLLS